MHNSSLPPTDRETSSNYLTGDSLRAAIKETKLSNSALAAGIGMSATAVSQYLNNKYPGDVIRLEQAFREFLRDRVIQSATGVETIECQLSKDLFKRLESLRSNGELGVIVGPAGIGKSRGQSLYLRAKTLAIGFRSLPWRRSKSALGEDLSNAAGITRLEKGKKRWDTIVEKTAGGGRLLIIDDAHELGPSAFQCAVDYHEETGNPVCLIGLPQLRDLMLKDTRRARRVDDFYPLKVSNPEEIVEHLISQLAPDANGDSAKLKSLCMQVANGPGAFGAVEKQLKKASQAHKKDRSISFSAAFAAGHARLLRNYNLMAS